MTRVGIVAKPDAPRARAVIVELLSWLAGRGLGAVLEKETADLAASVVRREVQEELVIAFRASERRGGDPEHVPAAEHRVARQPLDRGSVMRRLADDATLADVLASDFELRLHEGDDFPARRENAEHCGKDLLERDERHVDDRERRLVDRKSVV